MSLEVAKNILQQLGGNRFTAMTGAKEFLGGADTLSFKIPRSNGINAVSIKLEANDTYTMRFISASVRKIDEKVVHRDVYADQLQSLFTEATGLLTSLGTPSPRM